MKELMQTIEKETKYEHKVFTGLKSLYSFLIYQFYEVRWRLYETFLSSKQVIINNYIYPWH